MKRKTPYLYHPGRVEIAYEVSFGSPVFELPSKNVQLLRALYEAINPRFPINIGSMIVQGGNSLGDVKVRVFLLDNNALLDISPQRIIGTFTNITSHADVLIVKDCLLLAEDAWKKTFPDVEFRQSSFELRCHLAIDGGRKAVSDVIGQLMRPPSPIDIGATYHGAAIVLNYVHEKEKWDCSLTLDRSQLLAEGLFAHVRATYDCYGDFRSFQAQEAHFTAIAEKFFRGLNLRAASE